MLVFETPDWSGRSQRERLDEFDELRKKLGEGLGRRAPWTLPLRRSERALSYASSVLIEGYPVSAQRADKLASGEVTPSAHDENEQALSCYAHAMDHVATLAVDPRFEWKERVVLDLHFELCRFQKGKHPGLYRTSSIEVTAPDGGVAFRGPAAGSIPELVDAMVKQLGRHTGKVHPLIEAAMAHLNLVSIHPFEDGNGRISRVIQSLVLARDGVLSPEFGSIEHYLARHTRNYYDVLMEVQGGSFQPSRDATPWIDFCLTAHIDQAKRRLALIERAANRWAALEEEVASKGWDDRLVIALEQALMGSTDRVTYSGEARIANVTASNDLRRLVDADLLDRLGGGRSTSYEPTDRLRRIVS